MTQPRPAHRTYRLAEVYDGLATATAQGRMRSVDVRLARLFGLSAGPGPAGALPLRSMLSFRGFKPAELAMLDAEVKRLVKFEDIPLAEAERFCRRYSASHTIVRSAPYEKDGLMLRSREVERPDAALVVLYVSRDDSARALAGLEADDPDDVRGAGELLEIPTCCVEAFEADVRASRSDEDTLNDDACRRVMRSAVEQSGDVRLCPLSNLELLGYYPCHARCGASIERAERVLAALERRRAGARAEVLRRLGGHYLYWRLPFYARFPAANSAHEPQGVVGLEGGAVNVFRHQPAATIQGRFAGLLARALGGATGVKVRDGTLLARRPDGSLAHLIEAEQEPVLAHFVALGPDADGT